jgi:hypothetical protein
MQYRLNAFFRPDGNHFHYEVVVADATSNGTLQTSVLVEWGAHETAIRRYDHHDEFDRDA